MCLVMECERDWVERGTEQPYLDEVLALGLGDKRLQLGCGKRVDKTCLRDDEQQDLGTGEDG